MKQKIYITGIITAMVIVIGTILKVNHMPGAGYTLTIGVFSLIFLFLPAALLNHYRGEGNRKNKLLYILGWVTCLVVFGSMLFKVMHWPYAGIGLIIALPFPYVVFLPVYLASSAGKNNTNIHNTVYVLFLLAGISVFSLLLALNVSREKVDYSMDLSRNYNRVEKLIDGLVPVTAEAIGDNQTDDLLSIVNDYQETIFENNGITEEQWESDPWLLSRPDYNDIKLQASASSGKEVVPDIRLEQGLKEYLSAAQAGKESILPSGAASVIFVMEDPTTDPSEWTKMMFLESPRVWSVVYLDALETNLKLVRAGN